MIRIPPYPEWVEQEYLYFVASALPFWKNEILPKDVKWKCDSVEENFWRKTRISDAAGLED